MYLIFRRKMEVFMKLKPIGNISLSEGSIQCPECKSGLILLGKVTMVGDIINCLLCHQQFVVRSLVGKKKRLRRCKGKRHPIIKGLRNRSA